MRLRFFLLGVLLGLAIAPASGPELWRRLRNGLASAIDAALRIGLPGSSRPS
ncbi:MAG TPA: hypothetical protein VF897_07025 [Roseiflexaceae bacterium]